MSLGPIYMMFTFIPTSIHQKYIFGRNFEGPKNIITAKPFLLIPSRCILTYVVINSPEFQEESDTKAKNGKYIMDFSVK